MECLSSATVLNGALRAKTILKGTLGVIVKEIYRYMLIIKLNKKYI